MRSPSGDAPSLRRAAAAGTTSAVPPLHVYLHFPWCLEKCPYCDFVSFKTERAAIDHEGYADAVLRELQARAEVYEGHQLRTVFIGGGTPSLWEPRSLGRVLKAIDAAFPGARAPGAEPVEITAECNPTSLDEARAHALMDAGVTRLSVGVQSLDDAQLKFLGRLHDAALGRRGAQSAVASGARASADLIFGLPQQRAETAAAHARELVDLGLEHLSAYALTIEPGTRFGELARRGRLPIAEDDATCDAFLAIEEELGRAGLRHYEVSNYAKPGAEARHNLGYWRGSAYLGLGCAAYGFAFLPRGLRRELGDGGAIAMRYRNDPDPVRYVEGTRAIRAGFPVVGDGVTSTVEPLDAQTLLRERIMLGVRLEEGVDLDVAAEQLGLSRDEVWTSSRMRTVERLSHRGDLAIEGARLRITPRRRLSTDGIAAQLF